MTKRDNPKNNEEAAFPFRRKFTPSGRIAEAQRKLTEMFGFPSFRPGQEIIIDAILGKNNVLAIMPTGGGKSVCYQIPAAMMGGLTLVVSPLISLMHDQVARMPNRGLRGSYLDSTLSAGAQREVMRRALDGWYDVMYVSPERLESDNFIAFAKKADIRFLAIDEAHCVSQWGNDFRPAYAHIPQFVNQLPHHPAIAAFTATATKEACEDIARKLNLSKPVLAVSGFDRPNLTLKVEHVHKDRKVSAAVAFVSARRGQCGICYCLSRKDVEELAQALIDKGLSALPYHAGLTDTEREHAQTEWSEGRVDVVVATSAFGMGIDRSDVRYILSTSISDSLEAYYQQAGRAGRDGLPSDCVLYWCGDDRGRWDWLIEKSTEEANLPEKEKNAVLAFRRKQLESMVRYTRENRCLRDHILKYFDDSIPNKNGCGRCSACKQRAKKQREMQRKKNMSPKPKPRIRCNETSSMKKAGKRVRATDTQQKIPVPTKPLNENYVEWVCPTCNEVNETRRARSVGKCESCGQRVLLRKGTSS